MKPASSGLAARPDAGSMSSALESGVLPRWVVVESESRGVMK